MKAFVIINPFAGKKSKESVLDSLNTQFQKSGIEFKAHILSKKDNTRDIVRSYLKKDKFDFVVAVGGDGTVSQVIDGLAEGNTPLGIIPVGTGNLLALDLGIPMKSDEAVALVAGRHLLKKIDAMRIEKRLYVLNVSLGISAEVINDSTSKSKNRFGRLTYIWETLKNLFTLERRNITVNVDGKAVNYRTVEAEVFNSGILAKMIYPKRHDIRIDDGHLDVWVVTFATILDYPSYLFGSIRKRPSKRLSHYIKSEKSVILQSIIPLNVQADGDIIGTTPVEIEVLPGAITVFVPPEATTSS